MPCLVLNCEEDHCLGLSLLEGVSPGRRTEILRASRRRTFRPGQILYDEGTLPEAVHVIHSGLVKLFKTSANDEEVIVDLIVAPRMIGHRSLLDGGVHDSSAETVTQTRTCQFPATMFRDFLEDTSPTARDLLRGLSHELRRANDALVLRTHASASVRVARFLTWMLEGQPGTPQGADALPLKRWEIAQATGTSPETVSRTLQGFQHEGILHVDGRRIAVLREAELFRRALLPTPVSHAKA